MAQAKEVRGPGPRGAGQPRPKVENPGLLLKRIMGEVFQHYLPHCIIVLICIVVIERGVLYLFGEDYHSKLKGANANEDGLTNLYLIADNIGVDYSNIESNFELKTIIADKMLELFK